MKGWCEEACESIDAGFFSGDTFHDEESLKEIEYYLGRWNRETERIKKMLEELKSEEEK